MCTGDGLYSAVTRFLSSVDERFKLIGTIENSKILRITIKRGFNSTVVVGHLGKREIAIQKATL